MKDPLKAAECMRWAVPWLALAGVAPQAAFAEIAPPPCPAANTWPAKLRIEYDVTASRGPFSISGDSVLLFERSGDNGYVITINTDSAAIYHARQTSRGTVEKDGLRPIEYTETRTRRTPRTVKIDWNENRVSFSPAPDATAQTLPGLQDRASLLLQVAWRQRAGNESLEIPVIGSSRVSVYKFKRHGAESLEVPIGIVQTTRYERPADEDHDRIEAWVAKSWCNLPVRIRYTDRKGGVIDHRMRAARFD